MNRFALLIPALLLPVLDGCSDDGGAPPVATATATVMAEPTASTPTRTPLALTASPTATQTTSSTVEPTPTFSATSPPSPPSTPTSTSTPTFTATSPPSPTPTPTFEGVDISPSPSPTLAECCGNGHLDEGEECDDGGEVGGDGCAPNCTVETAILLPLRGTQVITTGAADIEVEFETEQTLRVGGATSAGSTPSCSDLHFQPGERPVTQRLDDVPTIMISVPGIACACVRPMSPQRCGDTLIDPDRNHCGASFDCSSHPYICAPFACRYSHGEGNASSGVIGCLGLEAIDYTSYSPDNGTTVYCARSGGHGPAGSAVIATSSSIGVIMGNPQCIEDAANANNGPDGFPCTDDDPINSRGGPPSTELLTTGSVSPPVIVAGTDPCFPGFPIVGAPDLGAPFDCTELPGAARLCRGRAVYGSPGGSSYVSGCEDVVDTQ